MPATIVGRCQRFDFRRGGLEVIAEHLTRVAKEEGIALTEQAAHAMARESEGSFRDALSLLDQASVLGGASIDEDVIASLIGSGRTDVQYALGDARGVFELVNGLVQEGQDLRHVTSETLGHFRDLMLAKSAPDQAGVLDVSDDEAERLRAQAAKFSQAELTRVIGLLLAAQTDMRWTTSPRLTLELALVRATIPETDAQPHALISRIERLERVAGIQPGDGAPAPATTTKDSAASQDSTASQDSAASQDQTVEAEAVASSVPVLGTGTSAIDVSAIRGSWGCLVQNLRSGGKAVLPSFLQVATPAAFDGETLELAFPPDRKFGVTKVEEREPELRAALRELFGIE